MQPIAKNNLDILYKFAIDHNLTNSKRILAEKKHAMGNEYMENFFPYFAQINIKHRSSALIHVIENKFNTYKSPFLQNYNYSLFAKYIANNAKTIATILYLLTFSFKKRKANNITVIIDIELHIIFTFETFPF